MDELIQYLRTMPAGPVRDLEAVDSLLAECWDDLAGSRSGGMAAYKLHRRMEDVYWAPPILSFIIERHGRTVHGSTRAELQRWEINVAQRSAEKVGSSHRQVRGMARRVNVKPIAQEIARLILLGIEDPRVKWGRNGNGKVRVCIGEILPDDGVVVKQTLAGRRKRLRTEVARVLTTLGWTQTGPNNFSQPDEPELQPPLKGKDLESIRTTLKDELGYSGKDVERILTPE